MKPSTPKFAFISNLVFMLLAFTSVYTAYAQTAPFKIAAGLFDLSNQNTAGLECPEQAKTTPIAVNIAHADQGFMFYNKSGDNVMLGRITDTNVLSTSFTKAVRTGRKTVRYNYTFDGQRQ